MKMLTANPYVRLMRLHQPVGIWLLLWPGWWALALASPVFPPLQLLGWFALGAIVMRSAGCIINDLVDRDIDKHVERTRTRPIANGEISITKAFILLAVLIGIALVIALQMDEMVLILALSSLVLVVLYPFMKRITWWPQAFLGLTFNWGALMGWAAVKGLLAWPALALYIGGIFWTLGYDTIYAHQDKEDDAIVGVKSTALKLGAKSKIWIIGFYALAIIYWVIAGWFAYKGIVYFIACALAACQFAWQVKSVNLDNPASCKKIFCSNIWLGVILFLGMLADTIL